MKLCYLWCVRKELLTKGVWCVAYWQSHRNYELLNKTCGWGGGGWGEEALACTTKNLNVPVICLRNKTVLAISTPPHFFTWHNSCLCSYIKHHQGTAVALLSYFRTFSQVHSQNCEMWLLFVMSVLSVWPSIHLHRTTWLPLQRFSWNLISQYVPKIYLENSSFIKIWQE